MQKLLLLFIGTIISFQLQSQELYFPPNFSDEWETLEPNTLNWCVENIEAFDSFLEMSNTNACLILKDGKIVHEAYFNDFDLSSNWYWASAGKSLTAVMVGIMQEEGLLSIDDFTTEHLGEGWTSCPISMEGQITIRQQMTMTTGLDYTVDDIYCIEPECLQCLNEPDTEWYYHNAPYTLLADVIESATAMSYTLVTNQKLTNKIGFIGLWSAVETGRLFFSTARGMARFGLLMLNNGDWDGEVIIQDKDYLTEMITPSQEINAAYGYLWWLNGQDSYRLPSSLFTFPGSLIPDAPDDLYAAIGKNGQILLVVPSENLIIVRMGDNPEASLVPTVYVQSLWEEYSKLQCTSTTNETKAENIFIKYRPTMRQIEVVTPNKVDQIEIYDIAGNHLLSNRDSNHISTEGLSMGSYLVSAFINGQLHTHKILLH